ncbi:hypothetical protein SPRG_03816 [Saprolegnia parasitica CBS 223.65]|uniref:Calcineurin-like phosphoesterase domain-containing protein n=1 Tax=Saprolegnia parasitica (strain CBS 223.65) TaxID=695850 RepID=A0A067CL33_SAPPC|nr:hypothetical protein SPRG_03816 [Saprolegnia parasitica CBS 223.65]KDO31198.1 hypothetical protein SPRG_03816 [Saprolegnia parasitica CBS 223.65]|eukprot:XP_012197803.1 hypothetical protein SPRG_03816 [Saprolegnia parasitica CBS 223.65]
MAALVLTVAAHAANLTARVGPDASLSFTVLQIPDVHFTGDASYACRDVPAHGDPCTEANMTAFLTELVAHVSPDLVVFTGDQVENTQLSHDVDEVKKAIDSYARPFIAASVQWAMVFGNHDEGPTMSRREMLAYIASLPFSRTIHGPETVDGSGNYHLDAQHDARAVFRMYFIDTGVDGTVRPSQHSYLRSLAASTADQTVPAILFGHIPIPEYDLQANESSLVWGKKGEVVSYGPQTGLLDTMVQMGDVKAMFVGHDHSNNYCVLRQGIQLCYGGCSGYGRAYNPESAWRTARVIQWRQMNGMDAIETWEQVHGNYTQSKHTLYPLPSRSSGAIRRSDASRLAAFHLVALVGCLTLYEDALQPVHSTYTLERNSLHHSAFHKPMVGRDPKESNRKSTPLEKLFDLTLVVALSAVSNVFATSMQHGDNLFQNTIVFVMLFFAVWNAWLPFTWFASMYDVDDALYRLATLGQMIGLLVVTDGIKHDKDEVIAGYVVLRVSLEGLLRGRAAWYDVQHRHLNLRSMVASCTVLVGWILLFQATLSEEMFEVWYFVLGVLDITLPSLVSRSKQVRFHAHHVSERYAEFTIIIFGESLLSLSHATVLHGPHGFSYDALAILIGSTLLLFLLWWFYFFVPFGHEMEANPRASFRIGLGHFVVHCALAAFATGLYMIAHVANEHDVTASHSNGTASAMSTQTASLMVAIPIALFLFALALVAGLSWAAVARSVGVGAAEVLIGIYVTPLVSLPALVFLYCVPMTVLLLEVMWMEGGATRRSEQTPRKDTFK